MNKSLEIEQLLIQLNIANEKINKMEEKVEKANEKVEKANKKAEKANKKAEKAERKLIEIKEEIKFTYELYEFGIPKLIFTKSVTDTTKYTSNHKEIRKEFTNSDISILSNIEQFINYDSLEKKT